MSLSEFTPEVIIFNGHLDYGYYYLGALHALKEKKVLGQVNTYICVSYSIIIVILHLLGLKPPEIFGKLSSMFEYPDIDLSNIVNLIKNGGLRENTQGYTILRNIINESTKLRNPTLYQFYMLTGKKIFISTCNLNTQKVEYFSYISHPNISLIETVMLAINIPGLEYRKEYKGNYYINGIFGNAHPNLDFDDGKRAILNICLQDETEFSEALWTYYLRIVKCTMRCNQNIMLANISKVSKYICIKCTKKEDDECYIAGFSQVKEIYEI